MSKSSVSFIIDLINAADPKARKYTSEKVLEEKKKQFDNYGANDWDDEPFPPIKESTIKIKHGEDRPLLRSGKLRDSLYMPDESDFSQIGSHDPSNSEGVPYLSFAKEFIVKHGGTHGFDSLSEGEIEKAAETYAQHFSRELKNGN